MGAVYGQGPGKCREVLPGFRELSIIRLAPRRQPPLRRHAPAGLTNLDEDGFLAGRGIPATRGGSQIRMGKRLYVGNLPYDADEASLREVFAADGRKVDRVHIVLDRDTQRPRGFAFVEMGTDAEAQQAIATLNGTMFGTRQLRVTEAEERRGPGGGPGGPPRGPGGPGGPPRGPGGPPRSGGGSYGGGGGGGGGSYGGGGSASSGGGSAGGGGAGGGGAAGGPRDVEAARAARFGPDARPRRERDDHRSPGKAPRRRSEGGDDDAYGGRRGSRRFDDDDE